MTRNTQDVVEYFELNYHKCNIYSIQTAKYVLNIVKLYYGLPRTKRDFKNLHAFFKLSGGKHYPGGIP